MVRLSPRQSDWKVMSYREVIPLHDNKDVAMSCARRALLRFEKVFPPSVAVVTGDWQTSNREMQVGDRFVQRVDLLPFGIFKGFLGQRCVDEVVHIYDSEDKCGFTVATTDQHDEIGEHTAWIRCDDNQENTTKELILESISASTFKSHVFGPGLLYARWLQNRADTLGREYLRANIEHELRES